jgi:hypothetical protein
MINQILRLSDRWFSRVSLGYFDLMYAGVGGESLYFMAMAGRHWALKQTGLKNVYLKNCLN